MANNALGQFKDEVEETAGEVVQDVKDELGQAIEQGVQSVTGTQLTPQQIQQKQVEDQNKIVETRRKIAFWQKTDQEQKMIRQQEKQKQMQKQQAEQQEVQERKGEEIQMQQAVKKPGAGTPEEVLRSQAERKVGKGVGG